MCCCRHLTFQLNVVPVTIQQCYLNNYLSRSLTHKHTPTHIKSTHPCNLRTKCPASVNEGFLVFQGPLGIYFSAPCFFLSSPLLGTAGGWFGFLWCVCVCGRGRGGGWNKQRDVILTASPFWEQDRKWAQQRKHDLLPLSYSLSLHPLLSLSSNFFSLCLSPLRSAPTQCHFSFLVPDTSRAVTCSCGVCV